MSRLIENPSVVRRMLADMLMTKSGAARKLGLIIPRPPAFTLRRLISIAS